MPQAAIPYLLAATVATTAYSIHSSNSGARQARNQNREIERGQRAQFEAEQAQRDIEIGQQEQQVEQQGLALQQTAAANEATNLFYQQQNELYGSQLALMEQQGQEQSAQFAIAQDRADKQAKSNEEALNRQLQKKPNARGLLDSARQAGRSGPGSTMLTGAGGVGRGQLTLGKSGLLGS